MSGMVDDGFGGLTEAPDTGADEVDDDAQADADAAGGDGEGDAAGVPAGDATRTSKSSGGAGTRGPDGKFRKDPTDADSPPPGKEPEAPRKLKRKEKVNGEEVELEATEDELWASHRRQQAAHKRFEEAAAERKAAAEERKAAEQMKNGSMQFVQAFLKNPNKALIAAGMKDPAQRQQWFEENFATVLEEVEMTPEQRELVELRAARDQQRNAEEAKRQEAEESEAAEAEQKEADRILNVMGEAFKKTNLPKDDVTVRAMAHEMRRARETGVDLTPEELAESTRSALVANFNAHVGALEGEALLETYPEVTKKFAAALRARYAAKAQRVAPRAAPTPSAPRAPRPTAGPPRLKTDAEINRELGLD